MGEKRKVLNENSLLIVFGVLFLFSLTMIFIESTSVGEKITAYATAVDTVSNVTIQSFLSIDMSANLTDGIVFGTVSNLPAVSVNATHNFDSGGATNGSSFFLNVSLDSNTPVDFCIKANSSLYDASGGNYIGITNETYSNSSASNITHPSASNETPITTTYAKATTQVYQGNSTFYRFYLDVPAATPAATYENSIYFKGVTNGTACGA